MSDLISRQAAIDAVKWGESVRSIRDAIARLPGVWKPASEKPVKEGKYLAVCGESGYYALLYYGEYEEYGESETANVKHGWYRIDDDINYIDYDDNVHYWMELPDMPEVEE